MPPRRSRPPMSGSAGGRRGSGKTKPGGDAVTRHGVDLEDLLGAPNAPQKSDGETARSSAKSAGTTSAKEGSTRKRAALSPPRGSSPKHSRAGGVGGQSFSSSAPAGSSQEVCGMLIRGDRSAGTAALDVVHKVGGEPRTSLQRHSEGRINPHRTMTSCRRLHLGRLRRQPNEWHSHGARRRLW